MGVSVSGTHLILLSISLMMASGLVFVINNAAESWGLGLQVRSQNMREELLTDISILHVNDSLGSPSVTTSGILIYVHNVGRTSIDPNNINVVIGGRWIPESTIRSREIVKETLTNNLWDPSETLLINVGCEPWYESGKQTAKVLVPKGVSDVYKFEMGEVTGLPDLIPISMNWTKAPPELSVTVMNNGCGYAIGDNIVFEFEYWKTTGKKGWTSLCTAKENYINIPPGENITVGCTTQLKGDQHRVWVDNTSIIAEINETNNVFYYNITT